MQKIRLFDKEMREKTAIHEGNVVEGDFFYQDRSAIGKMEK
jgi:hypothetical protein